MYIEPNTNIRIYNSVPLDNTYNHTLYFSAINIQQEYFSAARAKYTLANNSYQRVMRGKIRVEKKADDLYDCNYLAFQNSNYGSKWFYAFITGVEYINNITSEITFEIDCMQTYMFDISIKQCYVEREHSLTDEVGDNIIDEPIEIGDLTCNAQSTTSHFDSYTAVIATTYDVDTQDTADASYTGGLFTGVKYVYGLVDTPAQVTALSQWLKACVSANKAESIVSIFLMPTDFKPDPANPSAPRVQVARVQKNSDIHGYVPKNKKLLTYPYNFLGVECGNASAVYRYEWFKGGDDYCDFEMVCGMSCNPEIALVPEAYNGVGATEFNYLEKLVMKDFPQVAWSADSYEMWLATNGLSNTLQFVSGGVTSVLSAAALMGGTVASGGAALAGAGIIGGIMTSAHARSEEIVAQNKSPQSKGVSSGTVDVATRTKAFYFKQMQVTLENAKIIDDFFSMYGYSCHRIKVPNISSRPHWNYVKTRGCVAVGSAPSDEIRKVCSIYDKGITFWKSAEEVGNYSLNNAPT